MSTLNSKTNESNRFMYQFNDKLNLKNPNKNMALANLGIYYIWKDVKSVYNKNKFKTHAPTGMMNLICLIDLILFLIYKIILNTSLKNMKLLQIILLYTFMSIKQKTGLPSK